MPTLDITDEQASFLDALRDAIEDELVGPYGTVRRGDALQYLIDNYGEPDELLAEGSAADVAPVEDGSPDETGDDADDEGAADDATEDSEADTDDADDGEGDDTGDDAGSGSGGAGGGVPTPGGGDGMLDEMMALMDEHDEKWTKADSEETRYEVDLPDGSTETVQTQDDVRAILFKNYR